MSMDRLPKTPGGNDKKEGLVERAKVLLREAEERLKRLEAEPKSMESLEGMVLTLKTILTMKEVLQKDSPDSKN
jgi:hypothetical protein